MARPRIGINCKLKRDDDGDRYYQLDVHYVKAVRAAGGEPVLLPFFETKAEARDFLRGVDGVLFSGGPDLDPKRWGQKKHAKAQLLDPEKERSDFLAIRAALDADQPTFAICLGCQLLNVAQGGSLHQHIPDLKLRVAQEHRKGAKHDVAIEEDSRVRKIHRAARANVNSYHHQAIDRPGRNLRIVALAPDGLPEAVESLDHRWAVGVQWHPERMAGVREQEALFRAFIQESKRT